MKPVEIEFLIKNLTKKSLDEISSDVSRVGKDGKESAGTVSAEFQKLQQQSRVLKDVISGLEAKSFRTACDGSGRSGYGPEG